LQKKGKKSAFLFFLAVFINVDSDFLERKTFFVLRSAAPCWNETRGDSPLALN